MEIQSEFNEEEGVFFIEENNEKVAKMFLRRRGEDRIIIEHTEVSDKMKGKGAGKALVDYAVNYARKKHLKIVPVCSFAKAVLYKDNGYADVL